MTDERLFTGWLVAGLLAGVALDAALFYGVAQVCRRVARRPRPVLCTCR